MHVVSPRAVEAIGPVLSKFGTLYPVMLDAWDGKGYLFEPSNVVNCLNVSESNVMRIPWRPSEISSVLKAAFHEDRLPSGGIFVVPECPTADIYVCEDVIEEVSRHGLVGFVTTCVFP